MKTSVSTIQATLSAELKREISSPWRDRGVRAGLDSLHPLHRSKAITSFASPNVLGIFEHKSILQAIIRSLRNNQGELGVGRTDGANSILRDSCEDRIASFFGDESGLLFNSKNQAILTLITALATQNLVVIGHTLTQLPLADGCALIEAPYEEYSSLDELRDILARSKNHTRKLVFAEPVGLVTGATTDITSLFSILEANDCWGVLDETAAVVHTGLRGAGSAEAIPTHPNLLARLTSARSFLGTGLAGLSCSKQLRELLLTRSRYLQVDPPPPPAEIAGFRAAIDVVEMAVSRRQLLKSRALHIRSEIQQQGWAVVSDDDTPTIALWQDSLEQGERLKEALLQRKILVELTPAKTMLRTGSVVRIHPALDHTDSEIASICDSLAAIKTRLSSD